MNSSQDEWPYDLRDGWTILDEEGDHMIRSTVTDKDVPYGFIEAHRKSDGEWCAGGITRRGMGKEGRPEWDVIQEEPLTLTPSLLCTVCGNHGFVREGIWVAA